MKVFIASDHGGFNYKAEIKKFLSEKNFEVEDLGPLECNSVDYPDKALDVAKAVKQNEGSFGVLVCGTGIGMSIAANKLNGIRAALCHNEFTARMAREHNNANLLCLGERVLGIEVALAIVNQFFSSGFSGDKPEGERHKRRVDKFENIERENGHA